MNALGPVDPGPPPWGPAPPPWQPGPPVAPASPLPQAPAEYHQLLRGPLHRWWRPLVSTLLLGIGILIEVVLLALLVVAVGAVLGAPDPIEFGERLGTATPSNPGTFLVTNVSLILLIPLVVGSLWAAHQARPGYLLSVVGRFRWRWFARCLAVLAPLWLAYVGASWLLTGAVVADRPASWPVLALMAVALTPLQAAAEEVAFRGWFLQSLGSWFASPRLGLVVPAGMCIAAFAAAHGSTDLWILIDLAVFGLVTVVLTWRTGGLEAAIALHAVNNVLAMQFSLAVGGFDEGFVDAAATGSPAQTLVSVVVQVTALLLLLRLFRRTGLPWRYTPAPGAALPTVP